MSRRRVEEEIRLAFGDVPPPPRWCLVDSKEGEEPRLLEEEFRELPDWRSLDSRLLDRAPGGYATALGFFSVEAFRYYLPAFLLADLAGSLEQVDVVFHLVHGLDSGTATQPVNPLRYGPRTWSDHARHRFSIFDARQARAIVLYLEVKLSEHGSGMVGRGISEALSNYWRPKADG